MPNPHKRIQFLITPYEDESLEKIREETCEPTVTAVIRNALKLYKWALREVRAGNKIMVQGTDGSTKEVVFSGFGFPDS